jgi:hypothetical protein
MEDKYTLLGVDGNAFSVIAYVHRAMRNEGYDKTALDEYSGKAMKGNYYDLLEASEKQLRKVNARAGEANEN